MKRLPIVLLLLLLSACASVARVEPGQRLIGQRLSIELDAAWNHMDFPNLGPARFWTMEGITIDRLMLYSGLKDGETIHAEAPGSKLKAVKFRAAMQPDELVGMFEQMLTRDGSTFTLAKLEPATFLSQPGVRFEYTVTRKLDNVQLSGIGYATVNRQELFALLYSAPRLTFFPRHAGKIDAIARRARLV